VMGACMLACRIALAPWKSWLKIHACRLSSFSLYFLIMNFAGRIDLWKGDVMMYHVWIQGYLFVTSVPFSKCFANNLNYVMLCPVFML
jgi:hypothetical protein